MERQVYWQTNKKELQAKGKQKKQILNELTQKE